MSNIRNRKDLINRKQLVTELEQLVETHPRDKWQLELVKMLKPAYQHGWEGVKARFFNDGDKGQTAAASLCYVTDQTLRIIFDFVTTYVYPVANPTASERIALVATGGYGRGELAPYSDIDLLFLIPYKSTPWAENVVEFMLYVLWDLGLKIGHATRTGEECARLAKEDLTIRTALLESRYLWGDKALYDEAVKRFVRRVISTSGAEFVEQKLEERDKRHQRLGDSRYVVEPNIKEGKGGLRDLQTMWWIARYLYGVNRTQAVDPEILTDEENQQFKKAEAFLWTVRVALHFLADRAEERLTFDMQRQLADVLKYKDHPGLSDVERFMKHYFLVAKQVGDLTRIFCAVLEARQQKTFFSRFRRTKKLKEFALEGGRLTLLKEDDIKTNPGLMVKIFRLADDKGLDIHPDALRIIQHNLGRITQKVRRDPEVNEDFLAILTSMKEGEINLRRMNEAGVFGRFLPDFGRVVAQMQYDMYHHYTVDEHTIRAIGLLSKIEAGQLEKDHPLASEVIQKIISRRVLYVAVLLHDIAKGRGGDHSELGAEVAHAVCPRLGLKPAETETVAWLVRWHLLMSNTAFKRDLSDHKTIVDFCELVKSPERLRLLLILTVVDIRAVGPGIWNGWKGQLLRELYRAAEEVLMAGHATRGRSERVQMKKDALGETLKAWGAVDLDKHYTRMNDAYWIAEDHDTLVQDAELIRATDATSDLLGVSARIETFQDMTNVAVYTEDHPGMFARIVGALGVAGATIMGAKIHTSRDGLAVDNFVVHDEDGDTFNSKEKLGRLEETILETLKGNVKPKERLKNKRIYGNKDAAFEIEPVVLIDNKASNWSTVIEVNAKDRPGLLYDLAYALYGLKLSIFSAHVATYGERAIDVFYVRDLIGQKITNKVRLRNIEDKLLKASRGEAIFGRPKNSAGADTDDKAPQELVI
ncbi:[protein-PII] uridylyltransferase [Kordiimonas pumila]|uniref:Bifunctional uridylyltransferase/uridylyl-removing enzyme n=1 Tax=Kordiimonas pumila TaxID=2161677 RepID=A0ABV7D955_9PROT|nr:[protein-PII] uridylyltransferase [Kordiimonas pumila]